MQTVEIEGNDLATVRISAFCSAISQITSGVKVVKNINHSNILP
jgi:hypothetical protein